MSEVVIGSASDLKVSSEDICKFYEENWVRKIALSDNKFYKWQFIENSKDRRDDKCCVAIKNNEILGVMGLNTRDFFLNGERRNGAELTTWVVSEKSRNQGVGPKIITYLKSNYEIMIGMGISQAALPIYLRNGFKYIKSIPRYIYVIDWNPIKNFINEQPLARKYYKEQVKLCSFSTKETNPEDINRIFDLFSKKNNCFSRKFEDISWRYNQHPYFTYEHFIVNNDCFVALRIDKDIEGFMMAHCVDIFGNTDSYSSAISAAISFARDQGASAIDFFSTNTSLNATLSAMGLFSTIDHDFFKFPHLFHPIEIREPATTSLILWSNNDIESLINTGFLHITKQDADFDRPVMENIK